MLMQTIKALNQENLDRFIDFLFEFERPKVWQEYSDYGQKLKEFHSPKEVREVIGNPKNSILAIYFPRTKGSLDFRKINLVPEACDGHTFRFQVRGWALFHLYLDYKRPHLIGCRISCNSQKRAEAWYSTMREMGNPGRWDWKEVESIGRAITRKMGQLAEKDKRTIGKTRKAK